MCQILNWVFHLAVEQEHLSCLQAVLVAGFLKGGEGLSGAGLPLPLGRPDVWSNGIKACLSWRTDAAMTEDTVADVRGSYLPVTRAPVRKGIPSSRPRWQGNGEAVSIAFSRCTLRI